MLTSAEYAKRWREKHPDNYHKIQKKILGQESRKITRESGKVSPI